MQIAKKAALLAATASALVLLGTGTAAAYGNGGSYDRGVDTPTSIDISSFIFQSNECDTANGEALSTAVAGPTGETKIGSTCVNNIRG
ncbi:hypothetical protein GCM10017744_094270 [Streptomyces antimycoticus]|uniref:Chaplin domain-containing protein n=1 Tax=Streptomyces antimycoticus TaxID=68175 RepID=A0A4D4K0I3_9ACTN|nr:hypothetical protein [Streptomyces antimycoticus]GDY39757.1 hypothetical protein SANT12839_006390 [Streptomyces antimycoticus]